MKILCTGNPSNLTIAWAVSRQYPNAGTISLSSGWDLTSEDGLKKFETKILEYDVFVNSSYIAPMAQSRLLDLAVKQWMAADIKGHVFNLGTTLEWNKDYSNNNYVKSKLDLRAKSLEFNEKTGVTGVKSTYMILGGVNNGKPENRDYLSPDIVVKMIEWIYSVPSRIGLIQLDKEK